jgi:DNA-binding PucR family transcriptional regulator
VAWTDASVSASRARAALRLTGGFVVADEHLAELALNSDPRLASDLAARALAPLDADPPRTRAKLEATLGAWLDHQGRIEPTAAALGVHAQTVRYRLGQLRERFGDRLDDPDARFAIAFALRSRRPDSS